jgi:BirA family transcriptional regulator, biotin operon repressor / biotin---[acetyl-CoA-carboxylase] ligase
VAKAGGRRPTPRFGQVSSLLGACASTQDAVREASARGAGEGFLVVADHQLAGRGRRGRDWLDAPGQSLLFSLLLRPRTPPARLAALSLVAGIAVAESLPVPARLRWPNDVVVGAAKIAGVLAELATPIDASAFVALGIGVNANVAAEALPATDRLPATSLLAETGSVTDRLGLLWAIIRTLEAAYAVFDESGFAALRGRYQALDDLAGRRIELRLGERVVRGVASGVDESGRLVVVTPQGEEQRFEAGQVHRVV